MPDPVLVATRKLTRNKLAQFLNNHELIKAFENLTVDVSDTLPTAIDAIAMVADEALSSGLLAMGVAEAARAEADRLEAILTRVDAVFSTQRDRGAELSGLGKRLDIVESLVEGVQRAANTDALRKRLDDIESTVIALGRRANTDDLRKQVDELRALLIGT